MGGIDGGAMVQCSGAASHPACMSIPITCSNCERSFRVKDRYAGKIGSCPFCSGTVRVPRLADLNALEDDEISICGPTTEESSAGKSLLNTVQIVNCAHCGRRNLGGMPNCVSCGGRLEG